MRTRNSNDQARYEWAVRNKINHINPTMSPASKSLGNIESVKGAYLYYKSKGVNSFFVQVKHMGSYADVYLLPKLEDCYLVSRNGYKIDYKDRDEILSIIEPLHNKVDFKIYSLVIEACELMPWSYLGKGLIKKEFSAYETAVTNMYNSVNINLPQNETYLRDKVFLTKEELKKKYKPHELRYLQALSDVPCIKQMGEGINTFKRSLDKFGSDTSPYLIPFGIVKKELKDGSVHVPITSVHPQGTICNSIEKIEELYNIARQNNEEGIVVKPLFYKEGVARAIKIRTPEYLHLIYGVDFAYNQHLYYRKRSIGRKLRMHLKQAEISQALVNIPYDQITMENEEYRKLISKFFGLETKAVEIDNTL